MKVMSINCQNNPINRSGGASKDGEDYCLMLANHIMDNEYDFIGTQEMSRTFTNHLQKYLIDYQFSGKYRNKLSFVKKLFPSINGLIENNNIILKGQIIKEKTFNLPWFPYSLKELRYALKRRSLIRRIASTALVDTAELGKIYILNTHLDYALESIQKRQLEKIYRYLEKIIPKYPVIITGDFNMETSDKHFMLFIEDLKQIGIKRIPIDDKTNASKHREKSAIDHIFISSCFKVINSGIVHDDNIRNVTDHLALYVEFKK